MYLSDFAEIGFLNSTRGISFAAPPQVFCGLFLSSPGESGSASTEISYDGYTRMPIAFLPPSVGGSGLEIRNTEQITYPQSPIDAGTARHIAIFDSPLGGNMYLHSQLTEELPVLQGESPVLLVNEVLFFSLGNLSVAYKTALFNVVRGITLQGFTPYYSLWNGDPQDGGSELSGDNYARVPLTFSAPTEDASGMSVIRNTAGGNFNRPTSNWGIATHEAIVDSPTTGSPVWIKQRSTPKAFNRGIMPLIEAGAITVGLN